MEEGDVYLEELVTQPDPDTTTDQHVNADDGLSTCLTFEDTDQWREELCSMVIDETPSLSKQIKVEDSDSEDHSEDDVEPERSTRSITPYQMALHVSNDLLQFLTQNQEEEVAGAMFSVITLLESAQVNQAKRMKQSIILQHFKP